MKLAPCLALLLLANEKARLDRASESFKEKLEKLKFSVSAKFDLPFRLNPVQVFSSQARSTLLQIVEY